MSEFTDEEILASYPIDAHCHAQRDGDCEWDDCPQLRDGEPMKSGRPCPLDVRDHEDPDWEGT